MFAVLVRKLGQQELLTFAGRGFFVVRFQIPLMRNHNRRACALVTSNARSASSLSILLDQELLQLRPGQAVEITSDGFVIAEPHPLTPGGHELSPAAI